jgi:hypothetical protein
MVPESTDGSLVTVPRGPLARARLRTLRAVVAAIRPRGYGFDQPIDDDVVAEVTESIRHLPMGLRVWFETGLALVEYGTPLYARRMCRFSSLTPAEGLALLSRWEHGRGLRNALLRGLRFLIFFSFYQHHRVLETLQIDWPGRAATLIRLRAELMHREGGAGPASRESDPPSHD